MKKIFPFILLCLSLSTGQAKDTPRMGLSTTYPTQYGQWAEALLSGNGKTGIMVFGNPCHETIVFNDRRFNFPSRHPRSFRSVPADTLALIQRLCAEGRFKEANHLAATAPQWKDGGEGGRHPGFQLRIDLPEGGTPSGYLRYCDYSTGVVGVKWSDTRGEWLREAFVSRPDNVAAIRLKAPKGSKLDCAVSLSLDQAMNFPQGTSSKTTHGDGFLGIETTYPDTTLAFGGGVRAVLRDGEQHVRHDTLFVKGADEVLLGCNFHYKGGLRTLEECRAALAQTDARYPALLGRHVRQHGEIYGRVRLSFHGAEADPAASNEELLRLQEGQDEPVAALWERVFDAGRYHFLSSSSDETPPDLLGIWTGDCNAGWGGFYHLDANLNLQVGGGGSGAMPEAMEGYFNLIETWREDFGLNARKLLGCRGMLAGGNSPGLSSGRMAAINEDYPYQYATGEMAWLLYPFWEHYLITRDTTFLRGRLYPLLRDMGQFYEDFLTLKDSTGHFILAGSVSPENKPSNLPVSLLNNSAFDVAGARFLLSALLQACDVLGEEAGKARWQALLDGLPPYLFNQDGALKEWGWPGLDENYGHRHSSHLVSVWPYREISPHRDCALYAAACEALPGRTATLTAMPGTVSCTRPTSPPGCTRRNPCNGKSSISSRAASTTPASAPRTSAATKCSAPTGPRPPGHTHRNARGFGRKRHRPLARPARHAPAREHHRRGDAVRCHATPSGVGLGQRRGPCDPGVAHRRQPATAHARGRDASRQAPTRPPRAPHAEAPPPLNGAGWAARPPAPPRGCRTGLHGTDFLPNLVS